MYDHGSYGVVYLCGVVQTIMGNVVVYFMR